MADDICAVLNYDGTVNRSRAYLKQGHAKLAANAGYGRTLQRGQVVWDGSGEVVISLEEYNRLLERESELGRLEAYGVDNWIGYYEALNDEDGICEED